MGKSIMADVKPYYLYVLASKRNGTLYIGTTSNLIKRIYEHKQCAVDGFTRRYNVKILVYYEIFGSPELAIVHEKQMKKWKRQWKINLIEKDNPQWKDLYETLAEAA